jgi:hypothetical protein
MDWLVQKRESPANKREKKERSLIQKHPISPLASLGTHFKPGTFSKYHILAYLA